MRLRKVVSHCSRSNVCPRVRCRSCTDIAAVLRSHREGDLYHSRRNRDSDTVVCKKSAQNDEVGVCNKRRDTSVMRAKRASLTFRNTGNSAPVVAQT